MNIGVPFLQNCTAAIARGHVNVTVFDTTPPRQVNALTELEQVSPREMYTNTLACELHVGHVNDMIAKTF